jgi:RHS repeat-associated protein
LHPNTTHYLFEPGTFVPMAQATQPGRIKLPPTTNIQELIAHNGDQYDIALDPLWADEPPEPQAFQPEQIHYHHCDHLGTPQEMSDHQGHMAWTAKHKAWGQADIALSRAARDAGVTNPFRFQGQYFDEESGLHYNRYRYYDAHAGRFVSKDPIGLLGGTNVYSYAPNPTGWIDPFGLAKSGRWELVGRGRIRVDPPHVENTGGQTHAHCQCPNRKKEVVVNEDGSQSHASRGDVNNLNRIEKEHLRNKGFKL